MGLVCLGLSASPYAKIYKCQEPGGEVRFSETPCPDAPTEEVNIRTGEVKSIDAPEEEAVEEVKPVDPFASAVSIAEGSVQFAGRIMPIRSALAEVLVKSGRLQLYLYPFEITDTEVRELIKSGNAAALLASKPSPTPQYWKRPPWLWLTLKFDPAKEQISAADLLDAQLRFIGFRGPGKTTRVTQADVDLKADFEVLDITGLTPGSEIHFSFGSVDNTKFLYRIKVKARTFVFKADPL